MIPAKPQQTATDFMVVALSPVLIMALVGSLCFFLIEVFYQGPIGGSARWVMFWFVVAIVLLARIAIERSSEHAGLYGLALAATVWLWLARMSPSYFFSMALLAVVWFCANKLVWDCTFIDEDEDASGRGLLQKPEPEPESKTKPPGKAKPKKRLASGSPGRWVVFFSLVALPLFGVGQVLLPRNAAGSRWLGLTFLVVYMAAALGLLVTTSFLGLRRYLRQRYIQMPTSIAFAWVKFGGGIALLIVVGALFVPRPGANAFWSDFRRQADYRLLQASQYAVGGNPHGEGQGRAGNETGAKENEKQASADSGPREQSASGTPQSGQGPAGPQPIPVPAAADRVYSLLRISLLAGAALIACWWLVRCRHLLLEMLRACVAAIRDFFRQLLDLVPARKPSRPTVADPPVRSRRPLAEFKNPFFTDKERTRPPAEIILYTFDALQAWSIEQGMEPRPEQTAREFCERAGERLPELATALRHLSFLYAHAAYGEHLPAECNLEPLKEIWRRLTWSDGGR